MKFQTGSFYFLLFVSFGLCASDGIENRVESGTTAWVSSTPLAGCPFTSIQDAINNQQFGEIKLVGDFIENIHIDRSVNITGGYTSCGGTQVSGRSIIEADISASTVLIVQQFATAPNNVILSNLRITGGRGGLTNAENGGGVYIVGGHQIITFVNVWTFANESDHVGGGISIKNAAILTLHNSPVTNNVAFAKGGGIYCKHATVTAYGSSAIQANQVDGVVGEDVGLGGGIYADGCNINYHANQDFQVGPLLKFNGISANKATFDGAGIYAITGWVYDPPNDSYAYGTDVVIEPSINLPVPSLLPIKIKNNEITGPPNQSASAISVICTSTLYCGREFQNQGNRDPVSHIEMQNTEISGNKGGGYVISGLSGSQFTIHCSDFTNKLCNKIHANLTTSGPSIPETAVFAYDHRVPDTTYGALEPGPVYARHKLSGLNAHNNMAKFMFIGNQFLWNSEDANSQWESSLSVGRSVIHKNTSLQGIGLAYGRADMYFTHVTIADNTFSTEPSSLFHNALGDTTSPNSEFVVLSSLLNQGNLTLTRGPDGFVFDCNLYNQPNYSPLTAVTRSDESNNFGFVDAINGDYHLLPSSDGVDYCSYQTGTSPLDIDGEITGHNAPASNVYGSYDLGPDEYHPVVVGSSDVAINMQVSAGPYVEGELLVAQFVVVNTGPDVAHNINLDLFLSNLLIDQTLISSGSCTQNNCLIDSLAVNSTVNLGVDLMPDDEGAFNLFMQVQADENDPNTVNNFKSFSGEAEPFDLIFKDNFE